MAEPKASVPTEEPQEETQEVTAEEVTEDGSKKGANQRIRELVNDKKERDSQIKSLTQTIAELTSSGTESPKETEATDDPILVPGEEIDAVELNKRLQDRESKLLQRADAMFQLRTKQNESVTRINSESAEVINLFPELNPESDSFNRELSETVTEAAEALVRANPYTASVKSFVTKLMKQYKSAVAKEVSQESETLVKQASATALRPTSVSKGEKNAEEMTVEELERKLGVVQA